MIYSYDLIPYNTLICNTKPTNTNKLMRKFNFLSLLALTLMLFVACDYEYSVTGGSDAGWSVDATTNSAGEYPITVGSSIKFTDLSEGTKSHTWTLSSSDCSFSGDSSGSTESTAAEVTVSFPTIGEYTVTLRNVWDYDVSDSATSITAIQEDGDWVVEQSFTVKVYDDLDPALTVYLVKSTGETEKVLDLEAGYTVPSDKSSWTTVSFAGSDQLLFIDNTVGDPTSYIISGGGSEFVGSNSAAYASFTVEDAAVTYNDFTIALSRSNPADDVSKSIPLVAEISPYVEAPADPVWVSLLSETIQPAYSFEYDYASTYYYRLNATNCTISDEQAAAGSKSLRLEFADELLSTDAFVYFMTSQSYSPTNVSAGTYTYKYKIYVVDNGVDTSSVNCQIAYQDASGFVPLKDADGVNITNLALPTTKGEWVECELEFTTDGVFKTDYFRFRFDVLSAPTGTLFYLDDVDLGYML